MRVYTMHEKSIRVYVTMQINLRKGDLLCNEEQKHIVFKTVVTWLVQLLWNNVIR